VSSRSVESDEPSHDSDEILDRIRRLRWCGIYTRQSREPNDGYSSCQAQFDACLNLVQSRFDDGWVFNGRRYDDKAESSETLQRPSLQRLLDDIREGKVDRVVVHRLDRLSRRIVDCTKLLQELHERQIPLTIVTQPELGVTAESTFLLNLMPPFGEFEQEMTRERRITDPCAALFDQSEAAAGCFEAAAEPATFRGRAACGVMQRKVPLVQMRAHLNQMLPVARRLASASRPADGAGHCAVVVVHSAQAGDHLVDRTQRLPLRRNAFHP
jgi:hypothetical protein